MKGPCLIFAVIALSLHVTTILHAQQIPSVAGELDVSVEPRIPQPNSRVTINVASYSFDIDRSSIRWIVNGREVQSGTGVRTIAIETGASGSTLNVNITVITPEGTLVERTLSFPIGALDLIVEPQTYTPLFYRGRALPSYGASVRLIAFPHNALSGGNFVYRWERDYEVMEGYNGTQSNVVTITSPAFASRNLYAVEASSINSSTRLRKEFVLENVESQALLYKEDPLKGIIYERAVGQQTTLSGKEISYVAEPYFFSVEKRGDGRLAYEWSLNGDILESASDSLTLRQEAEGEGLARISLSIQNTKEVLQAAAATLTLLFGSK